MDVEMFPKMKTEGYRNVGRDNCRTEANAYQSYMDGYWTVDDILSDAGKWYWRTIRDLMLSGI